MAETDKTKPITDSMIKVFKESFGKNIIIDQPLAEYNTFGTGGRARLFIDVKTPEDLAAVVKTANKAGISYFMLGGGSNVLVSDSGYEGLVIRNCINGLKAEGTSITSGAGEELQSMVDFAAGSSLSGLEFATGIYGTVGGAVFGNAGAYGSDIGAVVESAQLVDRQGNIRTEPAEHFEFGYRYSKLKQTREFIVEVKIALKRGRREQIQAKIDEISKLRQQKLPENAKTAGCFFKNIPDPKEEFGKMAAGKLLDEVGAKDMHHGGARVYEQHANIIINDGTADTNDITELARQLKRKVMERFGIELEEEITYLGSF